MHPERFAPKTVHEPNQKPFDNRSDWLAPKRRPCIEEAPPTVEEADEERDDECEQHKRMQPYQ